MPKKEVPAPRSAPGLAEQAADVLRDRIISGILAPGQRLSETWLASDLGISRNSLREVFRLLTRERLVQHSPNRGVSVSVPGMAEVMDIYRVRRMIEVPALAGAWPGHPAVARMQQAVDDARACAALQEWAGVGTANMAFHTAIVGLTDSPHLIAFFALISAELRLAFGLLPAPGPLHVPYIARNAEILTLLRAGDGPQAAERLGVYLALSEREILAAFARSRLVS